MTIISPAGISSFKSILYLREYLDLDGYLKGEMSGATSPLSSDGIAQVTNEEWDTAIDLYLNGLSITDKQAFIDLFRLVDGSGQPLTPAALRARHISAQILGDKSSSRDLIEAKNKIQSSSISAQGKFISILYLREYLDLDGYLKGEMRGATSPLSRDGIAQVTNEEWDTAIDLYLNNLSATDKQAFIDLFHLVDGSSNPLTPTALRARHISAQILSDKTSTRDLEAALCRLDSTSLYCPDLTPTATHYSVSPNAIYPNSTVTITITGTDLTPSGLIIDASEVFGSTRPTIEGNPPNNTQLTITGTIPRDATIGTHKINISKNRTRIATLEVKILEQPVAPAVTTSTSIPSPWRAGISLGGGDYGLFLGLSVGPQIKLNDGNALGVAASFENYGNIFNSSRPANYLNTGLRLGYSYLFSGGQIGLNSGAGISVASSVGEPYAANSSDNNSQDNPTVVTPADPRISFEGQEGGGEIHVLPSASDSNNDGNGNSEPVPALEDHFRYSGVTLPLTASLGIDLTSRPDWRLTLAGYGGYQFVPAVLADSKATDAFKTDIRETLNGALWGSNLSLIFDKTAISLSAGVDGNPVVPWTVSGMLNFPLGYKPDVSGRSLR